MKRLTLLSFFCLLIIMMVTALNYSPDQRSEPNTCQLNAQSSGTGCCSASANTCKIGSAKPSCSEQPKNTCKLDCSKPCCAKKDKKQCGSNCTKVCCRGT